MIYCDRSIEKNAPFRAVPETADVLNGLESQFGWIYEYQQLASWSIIALGADRSVHTPLIDTETIE